MSSDNDEQMTDKNNNTENDTKKEEQRNYLLEARDANRMFYTLTGVEEARKHLQALRDFKATELPAINKFAINYGPKLTAIKRLTSFLRSNDQCDAIKFLNPDEKQELVELQSSIDFCGLVKSREQLTLDDAERTKSAQKNATKNAAQPASKPPPKGRKRRRYNGSYN